MGFSYPRARIEARRRTIALENAYRLIGRRHLPEPLGCKPHPSRFCDRSFAVMYAAASFETAWSETVVRDRFVRAAQRILNADQLTERAWVRLNTKTAQKVNLIDLREDGCLQLGAPTDAVHARNPAAGQALARALYSEHPDIDGILYASRFTGEDNFAIFDRALHKLAVAQTGALVDHPDLLSLLERHEVQLIDRQAQTDLRTPTPL